MKKTIFACLLSVVTLTVVHAQDIILKRELPPDGIARMKERIRVQKPQELRSTAATKAAQTGNVIVFEDFSKFTAGSETQPDATDIANGYYIPAQYTSVSNCWGWGVYQAGGKAYIGNYHYNGELYELGILGYEPLDVSAMSGTFTVSLKAKSANPDGDDLAVGWRDSENYVYGWKVKLTNEWRTISLDFSDTPNEVAMLFYSYDYPVFIDDVEIVVDGMSWDLTDGVLTISGTGPMPDYNYPKAPWDAEKASIRKVIIEEGITHIGNSAFSHCENLTSVTIPNTVTSIGEFAFESCTKLTSVSWGNNVTTIKLGAFLGCHSLTSITLPSSLTTIELKAFGESGLTSIIIPASVTTMDPSAFILTKNLSSYEVEAENQTYSSLDGVLFNKIQDTLISFPAGKPVSAYIIPNTVQTIGNSAFENCIGLVSISIPESVTDIEPWAFSGCTGLSSLTIPMGVENIKSGTFNNTGLTSIIIPNAVISIGPNAFSKNHALTSVVIPNSVINIRNFAFGGCDALISISVSWTNPADITYENDIFIDVDVSKILLYVPIGTETAYQNHDIWKDFIILDDASENNWLVGLEVSTGKLSPKFSPNVTSYHLNVPVSIENITLTAITSAIAATVSGDGVKALSLGENTFEIIVTAENGITKTYTVTVFRTNTDFLVEFDHSTDQYTTVTIPVQWKGQIYPTPKSVFVGRINYYRLTTGNINSGNTTFHFQWGNQISNKTVNLLPNSTYIITLDILLQTTYGYTASADVYGRLGSVSITYNYRPYELSIRDDNSILLMEETSLPDAALSILTSDITYEGSFTSIKQVIDKPTITISPNPATNFITISGLQGNETLHFYNMNSSLLLSHKATSETENISISHLPVGVYIVKISGKKTLKLIKI
jgi:hypothetical protein